MPRSKNSEDSSPAKKADTKKTATKKPAAPRAKKEAKPQPAPVAAEEVVAVKEVSAAITPKAASVSRSTGPWEVEQKIRERAYQLFLERNCAHGCDEDDWYRAEAEVRAKLVA